MTNQKILIAVLDQKWTETLRDKLVSLGHHCVVATSGKECQLVLYRERFDFIFLDPDIRHHSGIEVLKFVRQAHCHVRLGIIYSDQKKQIEYQDLFATVFPKMIIARSFLKARAVKEIENFVREFSPATDWRLAHAFPGTTEEIKINDKECTPVSLEGLLGEKPAFFDHYIRLKANHYVKLLPAGETMDPERLKKYAAEGVKHFYILSRIRKQFINYMNEMMTQSLEEKSIKDVKLVGQGLAITEILLEEIHTTGLKPGLMEECKVLGRNMNALIARAPFASWKLNVNSKGKYGRTFLTMFYSLLMCRNLSWVGDRTVEIIALGALLHDIGELKLPPPLREKDPAKMTTTELLKFQDHPRLGAEMLSLVPELSPQVIQIVLQHHENFSGDGFPMGLHGSRIYPLAKIVSLADGLAGLITKNDLTVLEGLRQFLQDREAQTKYDPVLIRALIAGFIAEGAA